MLKDGISQDDLALLLGVSSRTLRVWRRERRGPGCEFNGLQPWYTLTKLIPWLKKHRPDIDVQSSMERYRHARTAEKTQKTEANIWDEFFKDTEKRKKISQAYSEACRLDDRGEHESADKILLAAGETRDIVEQRRRHLDWKAKNPTNVT